MAETQIKNLFSSKPSAIQAIKTLMIIMLNGLPVMKALSGTCIHDWIQACWHAAGSFF